jgi:hypothetical protein
MKWVALLLLIFAASPVHAQAVQAPSARLSTPGDSSELVALRAELRTIREYNEAFVTMVQWGLGTVAGVALLLVGFSWFSNQRNYDRDREALSQDVAARSTESAANVRAELSTALAELRESVSTAVKQQLGHELLDVQIAIQRLERVTVDLEGEQIITEARYWEQKDVLANAIVEYISPRILHVRGESVDFAWCASLLGD